MSCLVTPRTMAAVVTLLLRLPLQGIGRVGVAGEGDPPPTPPRGGPICATFRTAKCRVCQVQPCDEPHLLVYPAVLAGEWNLHILAIPWDPSVTGRHLRGLSCKPSSVLRPSEDRPARAKLADRGRKRLRPQQPLGGGNY